MAGKKHITFIYASKRCSCSRCCSCPPPAPSKPDPDHLLLILVVKKMGARPSLSAAPQANAADEACRWAKGCWQSQWVSHQVPILHSYRSLCLSLSHSLGPILISFAFALSQFVQHVRYLECAAKTLHQAGRRRREWVLGGTKSGQLSRASTQLTHFPIQFGVTPTFGYTLSSARLSCHFRLGGLLIVPTDIRHIRKSIKIKRGAAPARAPSTLAQDTYLNAK